MCGIMGIFNNEKSSELIMKGLDILKNRGKDGFGVYGGKGMQHTKKLEEIKLRQTRNCIAHNLHSIVGEVQQPLKEKGILVSNCEIYNWKELCEKYNIKAKNDSELLLKMLDCSGIDRTIEELYGDYAFAYWLNDKLTIARDIIGVKPLWFCTKPGFAFASEKKALEGAGFVDIEELNPRKIIIYDIKNDIFEIKDREFFNSEPVLNESEEKIKEKVKSLLAESVKKRLTEKKLGILFSGGVDSTTLLQICKDLGKDVTLYTAAVIDKERKMPEDLEWAEKAAEKYKVKLRVKKISSKDAEKYLKKIVPIIEDNNPVKVGVALAFYLASELAREDGCKVIFSGLGSEEIFAGYERHKLSYDINKECVSGLLKIYERDLYRDDTITMAQNLELRVPFLDEKLIKYSLRIPAKYKLKDEKNKIILRKIAEEMGVPKEIAWRKKRAAQYGSNTHKTIKKLAKKNGYSRISDYLKQFYPQHNLRLAVLYSSGKDSNYALWIMQKQNYDVKCLVTIKSRNKNSYMYHTPNIELAELQAKALNMPIIIEETEGQKEKELEELEKALSRAKNEYKVEGAVTGALYSNYQRERIERICDKLGLKIFSPLWHINQETELREIIRNRFKVIMTSIAAEGLDKSWLGKELGEKDVDRLAQLGKKIGLNVAGEGGEYESLVLDGPNFSSEIMIEKSRIIEENKNTANLVIEITRLKEKAKNN
jgi:diphthine-ammonia ligase